MEYRLLPFQDLLSAYITFVIYPAMILLIIE